MHCKNIPTIPILNFLQSKKIWCNWYKGFDNSVRYAMPDGFNLPDKLVLAKMKILIKKGYVDGCGCGCRGDFEITQKGIDLLREIS